MELSKVFEDPKKPPHQTPELKSPGEAEPPQGSTAENKEQNNKAFLKWLGLGLLIAQNSALFVSLRLTRQVEGPGYSSAVAVLCIELGKLSICLAVIAASESDPLSTLYEQIWRQQRETLKLAVPALCYTAQNNMLFLAAGCLSAVVMQAITQTKTLWAAVFSIALLGRKFSALDWLSFVILVMAVVTVQVNSPESIMKHAQQSDDADAAESTSMFSLRLFGTLAAVFAAVLSGFAGVFLELMYTKKGASLWLRNVQLCLFTIPIQSVVLMQQIASGNVIGLFDGFHLSTWGVIGIQIAGGLITAQVIKYAGNMPKTFAAALGLVCTSVMSIPMFGYWDATPLFWLGVLSVSGATLLFEGRKPMISYIQENIAAGSGKRFKKMDDAPSSLMESTMRPSEV